MRAEGTGRFVLPGCVNLVSSGAASKPRSLQVKPGATLGAVARGPKGELLAIALAVVAGGSGSGKVSFTVSPGSASEKAGSLSDEAGKSITFLQDRVVVLERDKGEIARFLARRHGRIVASLHNHHLVEVDAGTANVANLEFLAEFLGVPAGKYQFNSDQALRLATLVAEEIAGGLAISLDLEMKPAVQPQTVEQGGMDQFMQSWFDPRQAPTSNLRLAEGMAMANIFLVPSTPDITIAFVDQGFPSPNDFSPPMPAVVKDYGWDPSSTFESIPQCRIVGTSSSCSWATLKGEAAGPGDNWHGGHVASLALSTWNDAQGTAGVGFPVARPYLIRIPGNLFQAAQGIARALPDVAGPTAHIISISAGNNCVSKFKPFTFDICSAAEDGIVVGIFCDAVEALLKLPAIPCADLAALITLGVALDSMAGPVKDAEAKGILVVAAATNEAGDDVDDVGYRPCTLKNVICVGGLNPDLSRFGAKGNSIFIYAPAIGVGALVAPGDPPGKPTPFNGNSAAVPIVSGALALALSINPLLTTDQARQLLRDSACKSSHSVRLDGSTCSPSSDAEVDKVGYLDLLELVRLARRSAGKSPLLACTGGWDAEEARDDDTFKSALPLPLLNPSLHSVSEYKPAKPDLSIHKIRKGPPSSDEDWYKVSFPPPPGGTAQGFVVKFSFKVEDPSLATLFLDLFQSNPCDPGGPPIHVPSEDIIDTQNSVSGAGEASVTVRIRTDLQYFMHLFGEIEPTGIVRVFGGNCYSRVRAEVMDIGNVPALPAQSANCH